MLYTCTIQAKLFFFTFASITNDVLLKSELPRCAVVHVLQRDAQLVHDVLGAPGASGGAAAAEPAAKEHVENVHRRREPRTATA